MLHNLSGLVSPNGWPFSFNMANSHTNELQLSAKITEYVYIRELKTMYRLYLKNLEEHI